MKRQIASTIAALTLAAQLGSALAQDGPSVQQLNEISDLLAENDLEALREYLDVNPGLLEGESRIAELLRRFHDQSSELPVYLGYDFNDSATVSELESLTESSLDDEASNLADDLGSLGGLAPAAGDDGSLFGPEGDDDSGLESLH